jgi:hypothetical protein
MAWTIRTVTFRPSAAEVKLGTARVADRPSTSARRERTPAPQSPAAMGRSSPLADQAQATDHARHRVAAGSQARADLPIAEALADEAGLKGRFHRIGPTIGHRAETRSTFDSADRRRANPPTVRRFEPPIGSCPRSIFGPRCPAKRDFRALRPSCDVEFAADCDKKPERILAIRGRRMAAAMAER